jgi:hypothetical protein
LGCLDNLAWIWVTEKQLKTARGKPLTGNLVGFSRRNIYESFSTEFQHYLEGLNGWFEGMEGYRHALAHRIPLYIPPFAVHPTKIELYDDFENQKNEALDDAEQVKGAAREAVDPRHRHHVAGGKSLEQFGQFAPVAVRARHLLAVNPAAIGGAQLLKLAIERLP